ncbi:MAG: alanine--tRNA ligase [Candidatus Nitrosothermus koennekii]|nr:MAG: alanine--tRNA ligase [Candidatus Nitrosothermus koennekii]
MSKEELKKKFGKEPDKYYRVKLFDDLGFKRQTCKRCNNNFWALVERDHCADCEPYGFIGNPPTNKRYDYVQAWREVERFFVANNHTSVKRYPVVCRWRDDLFFTVASIVDFQRVIGGKIVFEFPYNPLIVPQVCLRFNDIENVGVSGKHYTSFCMIGQHSMANEQGYWKDRCIELDYNMLTQVLGINKEDIIFQEDVWLGYGAFGYSLEYFVKGLELGNAVFTEFEGTPSNYRQMKDKIVDMGAGLERFSWITMGTPTSYDCCFGPIANKLINRFGIEYNPDFLSRYFTIISSNLDEVNDISLLKSVAAKELKIDIDTLTTLTMPLESLYAILDHTRALLFAISDGALPSNVGGGHNLRVILRRALAMIKRMHWNLSLDELIDMHVDYLKNVYPELEEHRDEVKTILDIEVNRYNQSLSRMKSIISNLKKSKKNITIEDLIRLYESDGITPEFLKEHGVIDTIPSNFYTRLAEKYNEQKLQEPKPIANMIQELEPTRLLYYEDEELFEFDAEILDILDNKYVILDQTAFYARGGGQEPDHGYINNSFVKDVTKQGDVVLHEVDTINGLKKGMTVRCKVDEGRRRTITRHHTATHIINSAARNALGSWVWQHSAFKDIDYARLDITHHSSLTRDDIIKIEELANKVTLANVPIEIEILDRNDAEQRYGFRIYQGGYVPSRKVRIVKVKDWDIEACAGTHCKRTGEIGMIKIIKAERVQDGVVRLEYVAGERALKYVQNMENQILDITNELGSSREKVVESVKKVANEADEAKRKLRIITKFIAEELAPTISNKAKRFGSLYYYGTYDDMFDENYHIALGEKAIEHNPDLIYLALVRKNESIRVITFVGKNAREKIKAGELTRKVAKILGGSGGGNDRFGQGGGRFIDSYKDALEAVEEIISENV